MQVTDDMVAGGTLRVDCGALAENFRRIESLVAPSRVAAVVKTDAYGLGAVHIAPTLIGAGCRDFFVGQLSEAIVLKPALPADARLYVLNGLLPGADAVFAGASVELLGPHQTIDDVATQADTISYEILTQFGSRYRREYVAAPRPEPERSKLS